MQKLNKTGGASKQDFIDDAVKVENLQLGSPDA
jgi:hypothetical protein